MSGRSPGSDLRLVRTCSRARTRHRCTSSAWRQDSWAVQSMIRTALLIALVLVCLLSARAIAADPDPGHVEPHSLTATCGSSSADLSWLAVNDDHLAGYDVVRKAEGETGFTKVNPQVVTEVTYTVSGLSGATLYTF